MERLVDSVCGSVEKELCTQYLARWKCWWIERLVLVTGWWKQFSSVESLVDTVFGSAERLVETVFDSKERLVHNVLGSGERLVER